MNYNDYRRKSKKINVGGVAIGGDAPISVQSMTNTDTHDVEATYRQVEALAAAGCDIVRITAPDEESISTFRELKRRGILVRHFSGERIKEFNRITVGTMEEMQGFLRATEEILKEKRK